MKDANECPRMVGYFCFDRACGINHELGCKMIDKENAPEIRGQYGKIIGYQLPLAKERCGSHKKEKLSYMSWFADCERRRIKGEVQRQCKSCGHWYWPDEL